MGLGVRHNGLPFVGQELGRPRGLGRRIGQTVRRGPRPPGVVHGPGNGQRLQDPPDGPATALLGPLDEGQDLGLALGRGPAELGQLQPFFRRSRFSAVISATTARSRSRSAVSRATAASTLDAPLRPAG